jgi:hypothetical protein
MKGISFVLLKLAREREAILQPEVDGISDADSGLLLSQTTNTQGQIPYPSGTGPLNPAEDPNPQTQSPDPKRDDRLGMREKVLPGPATSLVGIQEVPDQQDTHEGDDQPQVECNTRHNRYSFYTTFTK